jgi:hypothetical protein
MIGPRHFPATIVALFMTCAPAVGDDAPSPSEGLRLGTEATEKLRDSQEQSQRLDGFRQTEIRPEGNGRAAGVVYRSDDVYVGRLKRSTSPFHADATHWVFDEGVYAKRNGDRYLGRFHFFHENWGADHNMNQEDWVTPFVGRYILVGSFVPQGGAPQVGIFGAEIFGDRPIAFAPADQSYLAEFERRYRSQVTAFERSQVEDADSGLSFGQILALGLGGMALAAADIPAADMAQIGGAFAADVLSGGQTGALEGVITRQQTAAAQTGTAGDAAGAGTGAGAATGYTSEQVTVSCPSGVTSTIPISYRTRQCRAAMIEFAEAYSCNAIDDFARVSQSCRSACGNAQCRE